MPETIIKHSIKTALVLAAFAVVGTLMLTFVFDVTKGPIQESEAQARMALLRQLVPASMHDNDLLKTTLKLPPDSNLGSRENSLAYLATVNGEPSGIILETIAPDGYAGEIKLLVAIRRNGTIAGVRVLTHKETPGLGDYIDIERSGWIKNFDEQSLAKTAKDGWKVKKDGGQFEYMAGATITPRAVVKAVHRTLEYFEAHRAELLAVPGAQNPTQEPQHG